MAGVSCTFPVKEVLEEKRDLWLKLGESQQLLDKEVVSIEELEGDLKEHLEVTALTSERVVSLKSHLSETECSLECEQKTLQAEVQMCESLFSSWGKALHAAIRQAELESSHQKALEASDSELLQQQGELDKEFDTIDSQWGQLQGKVALAHREVVKAEQEVVEAQQQLEILTDKQLAEEARLTSLRDSCLAAETELRHRCEGVPCALTDSTASLLATDRQGATCLARGGEAGDPARAVLVQEVLQELQQFASADADPGGTKTKPTKLSSLGLEEELLSCVIQYVATTLQKADAVEQEYYKWRTVLEEELAVLAAK
ncbi:hypothetical protein TRVL_02857 [Trypanosoma vivax]|nr:hypothetical protein TRVL_02857 [Trypanosoma vivax]